MGDSEGDATGAETSQPDDEAVRVWLVDRQSRHENLVTLVYATPDGQWHVRKQLSFHILRRNPTTAAIEVEPDTLEPVASPEDRERYATQAQSMADDHDPDDQV
jgi:hypothetical protein